MGRAVELAGLFGGVNFHPFLSSRAVVVDIQCAAVCADFCSLATLGLRPSGMGATRGWVVLSVGKKCRRLSLQRRKRSQHLLP